MPTLFRCLSLRITMNPRGNEHNPPHVQAYYKEDLAIIDINTAEITKGYIPNDQYQIAKRFIEENKATLLNLWEEDPQDFDRF
ncbi:MAG: DUF4160 domain-containing protein [Spirochaetales bacterium]|nr:DUF4160 domain-containing protein [Candidatus Physcosoma equi]